jgi:serine protease Do
MKTWKTAGWAPALLAAAVVVGEPAQAVRTQTLATRAPRAIEVSTGRGGEIGVSVRDVDADTAKGSSVSSAAGVLIEDVTVNSPAEKAGIKKGDVVVEFDGERVRSVRQFIRLVQETPPGRRVPAAVTRDGQRTAVTVEPRAASPLRLLGALDAAGTFDDFGGDFDFNYAFPVPPVPPPAPPAPRGAPSAPPAPPAAPMPPFPDMESFIWRSDAGLGMTVTSLPSQLADYFGAKRGVLVTVVQDNSAARTAGFKAGDVVTAINGSEVSDPADLRRSTQRLQDGDDFTADVVRDKKPLTLKGKVERRTSRRTTRTSV